MTAAIVAGLQARALLDATACNGLAVVFVALAFVWLFAAVLDWLTHRRDR